MQSKAWFLLVLIVVLATACPDTSTQEEGKEKGELSTETTQPQESTKDATVTPEPIEISRHESQKEVTPENFYYEPNDKGTIELYQICKRTSECKVGECKDPGNLGKTICTKKCLNELQCDENSMCESHIGKVGYCVPKCKSSEDCEKYEHIAHCNIEGHCWSSWKEDGGQCSTPQECLSGTCAEPKGLGFKLCTKVCGYDKDCAKNQTCFKVFSQIGHCIPNCTTNKDCEDFPSTPICKNKLCWKVE